jgi:hypothetical protein
MQGNVGNMTVSNKGSVCALNTLLPVTLLSILPALPYLISTRPRKILLDPSLSKCLLSNRLGVVPSPDSVNKAHEGPAHMQLKSQQGTQPYGVHTVSAGGRRVRGWQTEPGRRCGRAEGEAVLVGAPGRTFWVEDSCSSLSRGGMEGA